MDIAPISEGHLLVIPKSHSQDLTAMSASEASEMMGFTHQVAKNSVAALEAKGFNLLSNIGAFAGQEVFHTHFHIVPRTQPGGGRQWKSSSYPNTETKDKIFKLLHGACNTIQS